MKNRIYSIKFIAIACIGLSAIVCFRIYFKPKNVNNVLASSGSRDHTVEHPAVIFTSDDLQFITYGTDMSRTMNDSSLLEHIRHQLAKQSTSRPRASRASSVLKDPSQAQQTTFVDKLLKKKERGFFVDCGAADGVGLSNSLFFEVNRSWTGILIDANPNFYKSLLEINRNAYVLNACLSPIRRPSRQLFQSAGVLGGIVSRFEEAQKDFINDYKAKEAEFFIGCYPLNSIMLAIGLRHIDYFSLDIEGAEIDVLNTIDWKILSIDVFTVEYRISRGGRLGIDQNATRNKLEKLRSFFASTGIYTEAGILPPGEKEEVGLDVAFVSKHLNL